MTCPSERFSPKLPPMNLYTMAPAWIFYARIEAAKQHEKKESKDD